MGIADIAKRTLWLRAEDTTEADGANVSVWRSYEGIGILSLVPPQAADGTTPVGGRSIRFDNDRGYYLGRAAVPSGIVSVTASSTYWSSADVRTLFLGSLLNVWSSDLMTSGTVTVQYSSAVTATGVTLYARIDGFDNQSPKDFTVEASNDGSSWTTLHTVTGATPAGAGTTYSFSNSTGYTYWRLNVTAVQAGGSAIGMRRMDFVGAPTVALTGASSGEVWVVVKSDAAVANNSSWGKFGTSGQQSHYPYSGTVYDDFGNTTRRSFTPSMSITSTFRVLRLSLSSAGEWLVELDGVSQLTASGVTAAWPDDVFIGSGEPTGAVPSTGLTGWIAAVVVFNDALTTAEATTVRDELTTTYITGVVDINLADAPASATADAAAEVLEVPLSLADVAASAIADAAPESSAIGLTVHDVAAAATAAAAPETAVVPLSVLDAPAAATAAGAPETVHMTGDAISLADVAAAAIADATAETTSGMEPVTTVFDFVEVDDLLFVELVPAADIDVAVPILSEKHPAPVLSAALPATQAWVDYTPTTTVVGYAHIWVDGQDITYFRDAPTIVRNWQKEVPFGDKACMWEMPQLDPWDVPGEGDLAFLRPKAPVVVGIVDLDGNVDVKWSGFYHARSRGFDTGEDYVFEAHGDMWAGLYQYSPVVPYQPPVDIGVLIPRLLNGIINRPFDPIPETTTGLMTRYRPPRREYVWQSVQNILAKDGWTADGRQWTFKRTGATGFALALKATSATVHGSFAYGNPGIDVSIDVDEDSAVDQVFCSWTTANGGGSTNTKYPGYELTNGKPYPNSDETQILVLGTTDADTDSGTGVTDWQRKVVELGMSTLDVTGVLSSAWVAEVRRVQEQLDLLVDGQIGPQTWTAVLTRVDESVDLTPRRLPMAWKPATWPTLDSANGVILGPNPAFDPAGGPPMQIDLDLSQGGPLTRAHVLRMARTYLDVNGTAVVTGSIQYRGCLDDLARTDVDLGQNHLVKGCEGRDVVVQVGRVSVDLDTGDGGTGAYVVTVDVDERARDALTIDQILERNREALPDPARRPGNPALLSRNVKDRGFSWDADSPCGVLPRTAVNGNVGLWSRAFVPFSEVGRLAGIRLHCEMPFAMAITASLRVTENMMLSEVGDPLAQDDPWRGDVFEWLVEEHGLLGAWGSKNDPCGYGYNMKSNGGAFKGLFVDGTTLEYVTEPETNPLVAVHLFAQTSGSVWGNFYPAWDVS